MTVHFIGAGPGAVDLITVRGRDLLSKCPVCLYAGSVIPKAILDYCPPHAKTIDTAPMSLDEIEREYVLAYEAGQDIARLHSGDLSVWSAVAEQIKRLEKHSIPYTLTPGVPSFAAAAAALKQELTIPEVAQSLVLTRISGRASKMPSREKLSTFAQTQTTLAIHLAIHALDYIVEELLGPYGEGCPVAIVVHASWPEERIIRGTLGDIQKKVANDPIERTALILVGPSIGMGKVNESALYSIDYQRRFRGRG